MPLPTTLLPVSINLFPDPLLLSSNPCPFVLDPVFPHEHTVAMRYVILEGTLVIGAVGVAIFPEQLHSVAKLALKDFTVVKSQQPLTGALPRPEGSFVA